MTSLIDGKVIRDGLIEPILASGKELRVKKLTGNEAYSGLIAKLSEELGEMFLAFHDVSQDNIAEEIADVIEVLAGLGNLFGVDEVMVQDILDKKYEEKGGFTECYFVQTVDDEKAG